jgi:hypothetical protein
MPLNWDGIKAVSYVGKYIESGVDTITFENPEGKRLTWEANPESLVSLRQLQPMPVYVDLTFNISHSPTGGAPRPPKNVMVSPALQGYCACINKSPLPCGACSGSCRYGRCTLTPSDYGYSCGCVQ